MSETSEIVEPHRRRCGCRIDEPVLVVRNTPAPCAPGMHVTVPGSGLWGTRYAAAVVAQDVDRQSRWFRMQVRSRLEVPHRIHPED